MEFNGLFQVYIEQYFLLMGEFKIFLDSGAVEALKNKIHKNCIKRCLSSFVQVQK